MNECMKHPIEIHPLSLCKGHWITQTGKTPLWVLNREMGQLVGHLWLPFLSASGSAHLVPTSHSMLALSFPGPSPLAAVVFRCCTPS